MAAIAAHLLDLLVFALFVAAPIPFGLCLAMLAERRSARPSRPRALLALLAAWCVIGAIVVHLLALLHQLHFAAMLAAQLVVFAGGAACLARLCRTDGPRWRGGPRARIGSMETLALLAIAFMGITLVWWSCAMPVVDWDSWAFHMPSMVGWLQSGTFTRMAQYADRPRNAYPYAWEALCTPFLMPFGEDVFVTLPNLVAWALLGVATYVLARFWRARRIHALACAALLLALPCVADVVDTMHVDLPFAALFVAGTALAVLYRSGGGLVWLGLAVATVGLACGTRTTAPGYAVFLAVWLLVVRPGRAASSPRPRRVELAIGVAGIGAGVVLASFWYVKNLLEVGGVLGPGMPHAGAATERGSWTYFASSTLAMSFDPLRPSSWKIMADRSSHELDVAFVSIVLLALLWPAARVLARGAPRRGGAAALALLVAGSGALFWITPLSALSGIQLRLGLPFLAVLAVAAAIGATRAGLRGEVAVGLAVLSVARTFGESRVVYALVAAAIVWGAWPRALAMARGRARLAAGAGAIAVGLAALTQAGSARRERERREIYGPAYAYLEDNVDPRQAVAYLLSDRSYILYGRRLARPLVYAPVGDGEEISEWAESVRRRGIRLVALGPWEGDSPPTRAAVEWLMRPGGPLTAISGRGEPGEVTLFRLDAAK